MDVTCKNCGAINRNTSRFCARCGELLPTEGGAPEEGASLDLPWLQTVQDQASKPPTEKLGERQVAPTTEAQAPKASPERPQSETPSLEPAAMEQPRAQASEAAPAVDHEEPTHPPAQPDEPPPGWVVSILEPAAPQSSASEQTYEPEELAHIMPWAHGEGGTGETIAGESTPGLPPWLNDITVQETLQSSPSTDAQPVEDLDLEGIEPFAPPAPEDVVVQAVATPAKPQEQVPEWLRTLSTGGLSEDALAQRVAGTTAAEAPGEAVSESSAPVTGPTDAIVEPVTRSIPVRAARPGATEAFAALIQPEAGADTRRTVPGTLILPVGATRDDRRRGPVGWLLPDGLIYLAIIAALLAVLLVRPPFGEVNAATAPDVQAFYDSIQSAQASKPVLVVYDWDASRSAEMLMLSRAVTHHLMSQRIRFVTMSTNVQGPGFAQMVTDEIAQDGEANYGYQYGRDYRVLGYIPGNDAAVSALVGNFTGTLPRDYETSQRMDGSSLIQGSTVAGLQDFGLIVALSSEEGELRGWIEQAGARTNVPIIAAVPQGLQPLVRSYKNIARSGLKAVIAGPNGATQYARLLQKSNAALGTPKAQTAMADMLNAQSVANLLVALVVLAALIKLVTRRVLRR
ncbi:MAG TPA: hypothetical protein VM409_01905 [Chloroflexia bacterium]|nr:hypothetical protein [Chloroflexia bacterium]